MGENQLIQEVSIHALARLAETRDPETGKHLRRTQEYVRTLANGHCASHPRFSALSRRTTINALAKSAPLHDIGKVGIPDHILLKPGKLTPEEWEIMKTHAELGSNAIAQAEADAEKPVGFSPSPRIARSHHEKWDGSGYPDGLAGDAIPIAARLMALADVFDALICATYIREVETFQRIAKAYAE
jgi:putative two-component system response regulator